MSVKTPSHKENVLGLICTSLASFTRYSTELYRCFVNLVVILEYKDPALV